MLVGEQPGDQEDRQGRPFVGPAGKLLDRALAEAGIDPGEAYVTNVVKHGRRERLVPTVHPSSVLRADDRQAAYDGFLSDLDVAARLLV
jgi:DNA polymerase